MFFVTFVRSIYKYTLYIPPFWPPRAWLGLPPPSGLRVPGWGYPPSGLRMPEKIRKVGPRSEQIRKVGHRSEQFRKVATNSRGVASVVFVF